MNISEISIEKYQNMSIEEKINFYLKIKNDNTFIPAVRLRKTKNMKKLGEKQPNGKLTFIEELKRTDKDVTNFYYLCVCDCGNWYILTNRHFDNEDMISCGCYRKERGALMCKNIIGPNNARDLTNQIYGDLLVLEKTDKRLNKYNVIWKCKCIKCGKEQEVQGLMLTRGSRMFCEYCSQRKSRGEKIIATLLQLQNIPFEREYSFETCRFPDTNRLALFDFYVNNSYIIEYDGEYHYKPAYYSNISNKEAEDILKRTQQRDKFKNEWCKQNNISLIRIPYSHLENICIKDLNPETSEFLIK